MNRTLRIFLACAIGAFIGSIVALQLGHIAWPLGALAGAFIAYLGYDFEQVMAAIPVAYRAARGWRPDYAAWRAKFRLGFAAVGMVHTMIFLMWPILRHDGRGLWFFVIGLQSIIFTLMFMMPGRDNKGELNDLMSYWDTNPVGVFLWHLPRGLFFGARYLILGIPRAIKTCVAFAGFAKKFTTTLFRIIHSELRLLCAVDAALGTAIGYFAGNAFIGAIAGGLLGVINYEIITVRVMQVAGAKSMFK